MQIEYKKQAVKYINACDRTTRLRIKDGIEKLPFGDVKKWKGYQSEFRLRIGDLRVLFALEDDRIIINDIRSRGEAYKGL